MESSKGGVKGLPKPAAKPLAVKKEIQKVKSEAIRPPRLHRQGSPAIQPNPSSGSSLPPISHYDSHVASNIPVPDPEEKGPFTAAANEAVAAAAAAAAAAPMTPQSALRSGQVPVSFEELIMTAASAASSAATEAVIQSLSKAYGIQFPPQDDGGGGGGSFDLLLQSRLSTHHRRFGLAMSTIPLLPSFVSEL